NGALVERNLEAEFSSETQLRLILREPDFTTAVNVAREVSRAFDPGMQTTDDLPFMGIAGARDASTIVVEIPEPFREFVPQFISMIEEIQVERSTTARVVVNERTGTVVLSGDVSISEVAVAHGNLRVSVHSSTGVSQPAAFGGGGDTAVVNNSDLTVEEELAPLILIPEGNTITDVVDALNALGTSSRDLIAILQAIDSAGALHAELEIQ
ncbi:MAG: flagellar basal body P-ring protein FlgI, partial [Myxococcales bacterium]|nr:flagellar basal body P-ring protein FlgI [Myxococcales bacterium]